VGSGNRTRWSGVGNPGEAVEPAAALEEAVIEEEVVGEEEG
jgi:hypothetical protein